MEVNELRMKRLTAATYNVIYKFMGEEHISEPMTWYAAEHTMADLFKCDLTEVTIRRIPCEE